jgi:DNA ligase (NAD+)
VLQRAGDVIPQILHFIPEARPADSVPFEFPTTCPCCGADLLQEENAIAVKCVNLNCRAQSVERLVHFVSKSAFDIDGLGEENIRFFFEEGIIKTPVDIFHIEEKREDLEKFEGWGRQSVENLIRAVRAAGVVPLDRFICSLGIPQVGRAVSKALAGFFGTFGEFLSCARNREGERLTEIQGVGASIANDFNAFFSNESNLKIVLELGGDGVSEGVVKVTAAESAAGNLFAGQSVVFTGSFESFSREEAKELVEKYGGRAASSVSAKTSLVVAGENAGQKLDQARKLGIRIVSEEDFQEMVRSMHGNPVV